MGAKAGNRNAAKKGPKRIDVHVSIADERRAKMERYMRSIDMGEGWAEQDIVKVCRDWLYDWIDGLDV